MSAFQHARPIVSRHLRRTCPYRVIQPMPGRFAVVERRTDNIIEAGFESYEAAWSRIMVLLDGRQ
jgi:hypothetical protein